MSAKLVILNCVSIFIPYVTKYGTFVLVQQALTIKRTRMCSHINNIIGTCFVKKKNHPQLLSAFNCVADYNTERSETIKINLMYIVVHFFGFQICMMLHK
jgi:hypothetical protein